MADTAQPDFTILTVQLLSAYVTNNPVPSNELAALIQTTRAALVAEAMEAAPEVAEHVAAVSIRKSTASRAHIISLIDGRPYKTLKRHLATHGLTPDSYRARYGLPKTYPMVAADYSAQRRAVAQKLGLGQRGTAARMGAAKPAEAADTPTKDVETVAPERVADAPAKAPKSRGKTDVKTPPAPAAAPKPVRQAKAAPADKSVKGPTDAASKKPKASRSAKAVQTPAVESSAVADEPAGKSSRRRLSIQAGKKKTAEPAA